MKKLKVKNFQEPIQQEMNLEETLKHYIEEKMELVRLELILDSLYMSTEKDENWSEKYNNAQELHKESYEKIEKLYALWQEKLSSEENLKQKTTGNL